jgi:hypothetical protein
VLLRKQSEAKYDDGATGAAGVADLTRLVPANAGVYVAKSNPKAEECVKLLETKILAPHLGPAAPEKVAPQVQLGNGETGVGSDLETRIDQAPVQQTESAQNGTLLKEVFAKNPVTAALQLQSTDANPQDAFVRMHSVIVFLGGSDWDERVLKSALVDFVRPGLTTGDLGVVWRKNSNGNSNISELDGLWPLAVAVRGKYLLVADARRILESTLAYMDRKATDPPSTSIAGFNHQSEQSPFLKLTRMLNLENSAGGAGQPPDFFSGNIGSLSQTLRAVASEKIIVRDAAEKQTQTVRYAWVQ